MSIGACFSCHVVKSFGEMNILNNIIIHDNILTHKKEEVRGTGSEKDRVRGKE